MTSAPSMPASDDNPLYRGGVGAKKPLRNALLPPDKAPQPAPIVPAQAAAPVSAPPVDSQTLPPGIPPGQGMPGASAAIPGQAMTMAIKTALAPDKMTDATLEQRLNRAEYAWHAFGNLLKKPDITQEDFVDAVHTAIKDKVVPASEAGEILSAMPDSPAKLRSQIEQYSKASMHAMIHLVGEKQNRAAP